MRTSSKLKLAGALLGVTIITATTAVASGNMDKVGMGSCSGSQMTTQMTKSGDTKSVTVTCGAAKKAAMAKQAAMKKANNGKCGVGTCGSSKKKAM